MDALYKINPAALFLIQGPSQLALTGTGGSSYITNIPLTRIPRNADSDPNSFFKQVLVKPYVTQVGPPHMWESGAPLSYSDAAWVRGGLMSLGF